MQNTLFSNMLQRARNMGAKKIGKTVLFWHHGGFFYSILREVLIALALDLRGYDIHFIVCDGTPKVCSGRCETMNNKASWDADCIRCQAFTLNEIKKYGFSYSFLSEYLPLKNLENIKKNYQTPENLPTIHGIHLGFAALDGAKRLYETHDEDLLEPEIVAESCFTTMCNHIAAKEAVKRHAPYRATMLHTSYADHEPAMVTFTHNNVPTFALMRLYSTQQMAFSTLTSERTEQRKISEQQWQQILTEGFTAKEETLFNTFFSERYESSLFPDIQEVTQMPYLPAGELRNYLGFDSTRPIFLFPMHVSYDLAVGSSSSFFGFYVDLVLEVCREMFKNTQVQWIIKVHPHEVLNPPQSHLGSFLRKHFPVLPSHVRIIDKEPPFSAQSFQHLAHGSIGDNGTTLLEMACLGKTLILTGKGLYHNKGFTVDSDNKENCLQKIALAHTLPALTPEQTLLARKLLLIHFFRTSFKLPSMDTETWQLTSPDAVFSYLPFADKELDIIVESIENCTIALKPLDWL